MSKLPPWSTKHHAVSHLHKKNKMKNYILSEERTSISLSEVVEAESYKGEQGNQLVKTYNERVNNNNY